MTPNAPCDKVNPSTRQVVVGTSGAPLYFSSESYNLVLPELPIKSYHTMPTLHSNLMSIGKLCDHNCRVLFGKASLTVFFQDNAVILRG